MTPEQIKNLIDQKIAGQGTMVDVGGALPTILKEIVNLASAGANVQSDWDEDDNANPSFIKNKPTIPKGVLVAQVAGNDISDATKQEFLVRLRISESELDGLLAGEYFMAQDSTDGHTYLITVPKNNEGDQVVVIWGSDDNPMYLTALYTIRFSQGKYSLGEV